jgi:hypothetical protein
MSSVSNLAMEMDSPRATPGASLCPTSLPLEVRVVRTVEEVEEIREVWSSWKSHRDSNIDLCQQVVWMREEVLRPHVIAVYRDGRPTTILVGRLERTRITPKIGYLRLPGIPSLGLLFSYGGLLGDDSVENCNAILGSIMNTLRQGEADVAVFHQPAADSPLYQNALSMPSFFCRDYLAKPTAHHFMILQEKIEQVYLGLSSSHRKHLRSEAKKLQTDFQGRLRISSFGKPSELDEAIRDAEEIAKRTYQRELGFGFEPTQQSLDLLRFYAAKGWLTVYILYLDEIPCAFSIGTIADGLYCCDYLGFDPRFRKYSPGTFLLTKMFEDLCKAGIGKVDFGSGGGAYKERFGNLHLVEASVSIFAPTSKGLALNAVRTSTGMIDKAAKKLLDKTNVLPRIKKLWRDRAAQSAVPQSSTSANPAKENTQN